eukprot:CAMPEP_0119384916 /NCGR_PEP_ID=MMETSP1334-20130426/88365_1 /TAXON_ID=127549 /ORGANISM="Calcidiscus leptoporus, Strain RCC1130" /LENGTH=37 /DNA_ID= /DNA_START= /DNA_END= /DNA_ORIENTATION=
MSRLCEHASRVAHVVKRCSVAHAAGWCTSAVVPARKQ